LQPSYYHLPRSDNYTLIAYRSSHMKSAPPGRFVENNINDWCKHGIQKLRFILCPLRLLFVQQT